MYRLEYGSRKTKHSTHVDIHRKEYGFQGIHKDADEVSDTVILPVSDDSSLAVRYRKRQSYGTLAGDVN